MINVEMYVTFEKTSANCCIVVFKIMFTVQDTQHREIGICVSHIPKHFMMSTPHTTRARKEEGQRLFFSASLTADDLLYHFNS